MTTNKEVGMKLIKEAEDVRNRDLKGAWETHDYNMTVRRAQEVVELVLKGVLGILGVDYPKIHDVGLIFAKQAIRKSFPISSDVIEKVEEISSWLAEARAPSFYLERDYTEEDAQKAFEDATFVCEVIKIALGKMEEGTPE
jgi:HEPN domain-containing protein